MEKIVECVPNFSEGKNIVTMEAIFNAAKSMPSVKVIELEYNPSHNRCLFTIIGTPSAVFNAVFESIKVATLLIDMNTHKGEHPRIGATDVVPFVPVAGVSMQECAELAVKLGKMVAKELKIPVFLYEFAATKPENSNLADVRKGQFEGFKAHMKNPDFGPSVIHPTAGAIVIGARKYLVAYNVNLNTTNIQIAKEIAKKIREKDGGLKGVKALGFDVAGIAQISMNLVDFNVTNFDEIYREIERLANEQNVTINNSEIYGLIPLDSIIQAIKTTFKLDTFNSNQIIETRIFE